jgi:hypothetical protein
VGIAIAGFAGVIAALRAPGGKIGPYAALRIGMLLGLSAIVVLLSLLPFAFQFGGLGTGAIWSLGSGAMVVLVAVVVAAPYTFLRSMRPTSRVDLAPGLGGVMSIMWTIQALNAVLQIANVAFIGQLWPFYVGLLTITALSLVSFAYILLAPSRAEVPA